MSKDTAAGSFPEAAPWEGVLAGFRGSPAGARSFVLLPEECGGLFFSCLGFLPEGRFCFPIGPLRTLLGVCFFFPLLRLFFMACVHFEFPAGTAERARLHTRAADITVP